MRFFIGLSGFLPFLAVVAATFVPSIQAAETTATGGASSGTRRLGGNKDATAVGGAAGVSRSLQTTCPPAGEDAADWVDCLNGSVRGTTTTCAAACDGSCCVGDLACTDTVACIKKDGSCSGGGACWNMATYSSTLQVQVSGPSCVGDNSCTAFYFANSQFSGVALTNSCLCDNSCGGAQDHHCYPDATQPLGDLPSCGASFVDIVGRQGFDDCDSCGNGVVDSGEVCDGDLLAGQTCTSASFADVFDGGTLACSSDCLAFDTAGCSFCGNGIVENGEVCEVSFGADPGGQTCATQGYTTGTLYCSADCASFDTSNCFGESTTLAEAQTAAGTAKNTLDAYFTARSAKLVADHNLAAAVAACEDATEAATEAAALETETTNAYNQAVLQEAALEDVYNAAVTASQATDATPADKTWKLLNAKAARDQAVAEREAADTAKSAAESDSGTAEGTKTTACDYATLSTAATAADSAYTAAETAVEDDDNIPTINPTTLDFIYEDLDGDLIPNQFDACPTQMGLRRNSPTIPGPQDFCPSGCPELWDTVNDQAVDSDGDGIPDCEDRCPFEGSDGIEYSHADHLTTVSGFSLAWNGCKDSDGDGIPDIHDACPDQNGGDCKSGCPDPGNNIDSDLDGVIDCADRCPSTYAVGTADGCPDLDMDGVPDSIDYCMATPGSASFAFDRTLELDGSGNPVAKDLTIMGCPDADADLVPDAVDLCDAPSYPNQGDEVGGVKTSGVAVVDKSGCPLDSDNDSVFDGYDQCDATVHSDNSAHDPNAIVYTKEDAGVDANLLGCPKDTDNDGVVDGIDQCPNEGGFIDSTGCPKDSDNDGVSDCVSTSSTTACHSTTIEPTDTTTCCTVERDFCTDTPRGATVFTGLPTDTFTLQYAAIYAKADETIQTGCSYDSDTDEIHDGIDQCPGTTPTEIALDDSKLTIDMKGCPILSAKMWESTVVDFTTSNSNSANPLIELLFSVDADLPQVLTARQYQTSQMIQVQIMDPTCQNKFDDVTTTGDEVLPLTVNMNNKGSFTGQIPFDSIPISVDVQLNPDNFVGSPVWTTSAPYDVGTIDFCLNFAILSDTLEPVTFTELKTTVMLDMTQGFSVIGTAVERNQAEEATELIDIEYPLDTCQCDSADVCVDDNDLVDSFLRQSDSLKLCVRFRDGVLPPAYVQMTDVKTFSCSQGGLMVTPIVDFEREGDGGQLTAVTRKNAGAGINDRMLTIDTQLPAAFFGPEERPVDCTGTIVYSFTENAVIVPPSDRRVLAEASIATGTSTGSAVQRRADSLTEASSEFTIDVVLAKAGDGKSSAGIIAGVAVGSAVIVASAIAIGFMKYRSAGNISFLKRESADTGDSWSVSPTDEGFRAKEGFVA